MAETLQEKIEKIRNEIWEKTLENQDTTDQEEELLILEMKKFGEEDD